MTKNILIMALMLGMSAFSVAEDFSTFSALLNTIENSRLMPAEERQKLIDELESRILEASLDERQRLVLILAHRNALQGNLVAANEQLDQVLSSTPSPSSITRAYSLKVQINLMQSDYSAAFTNLQLALKSIANTTSHRIQFEVYELAARTLSYAGEKEKALAYGQEALMLANSNGDQFQKCLAAVSLLYPYPLSGSYHELPEGISLAESNCKGQSAILQATVLAFKADMLIDQGRYEEALDAIADAERWNKESGYDLGMTNLAIKKSIIALKTEDAEGVIAAANSLSEILRSIPPETMKMEQTIAYHNLANALARTKHWQEAAETYQELLKVESDYRNEQKEIRSAYLQVQFDTTFQESKIAQLTQEQNILKINEESQTEKRRLLQFGVGAVTVICILLMMALHRLRNQSLQLRKLAQIDGLTGLHNRRHALMLAEQLYASCLRRNSPLAVVMVDLDLFKEINDRFGHAAGDEVLRSAARHFASCLRKQDVIGRTGGEEFAIFLPDTDLNAAITVVERCRTGVGEVQEGEQRRSVTASFGIAVAINDRFTLDELLQQADKALYNAKANGRNQVAIARDLAYAASAYDEPASLI